MPRRQNSQLKRPNDQALAHKREHVPLALSADEEDPKPDRELRSKVGEGLTLAKTSVEDEEQEDVAVADEAADVKADSGPRTARPFSVTTVVNMDIMLDNVLRQPAVLAVAILGRA